jgi:hypothetical protein
MHKDELIQLHTLMAQIRRHFEHMGVDNSFTEYDSLSISPLHVHRSKAEHKHAIFVLGNDIAAALSQDDTSGIQSQSIKRLAVLIAAALSQDDTSGIGRTSERMHELAMKAGSQLVNTN